VQWSTTLQREVPSEVLSRVSAYDWFGSLAFLPIAMAVVGPISGVIGITSTLVGSGVIMIALIIAVLFVPAVIALQSPAAAAERAPGA
jgi:hypothetical protein